MAGRGHNVHLFSYSAPVWHPRRFNDVKLHTITSPNTRHPAQLYVDWSLGELKKLKDNLLTVIQEEQIEVLHLHYGVPFLTVAAEIKKILGRRAPLMVATLHGTDVSYFGRDGRFTAPLKAALAQMDHITTVSQAHARLADEIFKLRDLPRVIPNFVDLDWIENQVSAAVGPDRQRSTNRLVHISNFRPIKNPAGVARIFKAIHQQFKSELWLIGDGQEMPLLKSILSGNGVSEDVRFWNIQHEVAPFLWQSSLMVIASHYESFCLAALEAMACGVPVLAPSVGGIPELVTDGETGLLFPKGDEKTAAAKAVALLNDSDRLGVMSAAARRRALDFSHKRIIPLYEDLYRCGLNGRRI